MVPPMLQRNSYSALDTMGQGGEPGGTAAADGGPAFTTVKKRRKRRPKQVTASDGDSSGTSTPPSSGRVSPTVLKASLQWPPSSPATVQLSVGSPAPDKQHGNAADGQHVAASLPPLPHQQQGQRGSPPSSTVVTSRSGPARSKSDVASHGAADGSYSSSRHPMDPIPEGQHSSKPSPSVAAASVAGGGAGAVARRDLEPLAAGPPPGAATAAAQQQQQQAAPGSLQSFLAYWQAELHPGPTLPTTDVVWGQTERDRVYNAILSVPYQLERLLWFGVLLCCDSFLAVFTLVPLRVLHALGTLLLAALPVGPSSSSSAGGSRSSQRARLRGGQLFDLLGGCMFLVTLVFLWHLDAGRIYFWMKDMTQEFVKLSVLYTALELSDKICCSFGVDVLEALAASCTQACTACSLRAVANLASDACVAVLLLLVHGAALMAQAMVFGVAMNSKKNTLVALLIAANFAEIKGTVLKRFDASKLFVLACQDVVERFHLLLILAFVLAEEMGSSGQRAPNPQLLVQCAVIFLAEVVIDVVKHAVLGKFNDIRPGVYREFMKDLCERVSSSQSHNVHKLVGFEPFAPSAFFLRIALALAAATRHDSPLTPKRLARLGAAAALAWAALLALKLGLGFLLKRTAEFYVRHYERRRGRGRGGTVRARLAASTAGSAGLHPAGQQHVAQQQAAQQKKED